MVRARVFGRAAKAPIELKLYAIDVSFDVIANPVERDYFMNLPTTFALPPEAIDRLRVVAGRLLRESPVYRELLRDLGNSGATEDR